MHPIVRALFAISILPTFASAETIQLGSRRELFVDPFLIEKMDSDNRVHGINYSHDGLVCDSKREPLIDPDQTARAEFSG